MDSTPSPMRTLGALLRQFRTSTGLTQEALAARAGISVYSISNLERDVGHAPRADTLALLADALSLSPDQRAALQEAVVRLRQAHPIRATAATATAIATAAPRKPPPYHVPIPPTALIGREHELAALSALLHAQAADRAAAAPRLLTLCGPPGVGKTRLATEVARAHAGDFRDGAAWVPLASLRHAHLVAGAIAQALDIRQRGAELVATLLQRHLQHRHMLLLLDNFEHLLPAAPLVADLLAACPGVCILITSRAPLRLRAEQEFPLDPLPLPPPESPVLPPLGLAHNPAVALFVARAQAIVPTFTLTPANAPVVAAICRRLDGLPLAIELAAARLTILHPAALLTLLEHRLPILTGGPHDMPVHQQTLRGTLAWSYDLLATDEQALFRRLAVFAGGAPLAAIAPVCGGGGGDATESAQGDGPEVLTALSALVDHHLLMRLDATAPLGEGGAFKTTGATTPSDPRYGMLETIREYAWDQLCQHDEAATVERAHAIYFRAFVEAAEPKLRGAEQAEWLARLETEHDNLRAALRWFMAQRELLPGLRLAGALSRFWHMHGYLGEGRAWLEDLLALADVQEDEHADDVFRAAHAQALNSAGVLAYRQGDYPRATTLYEASLSMRRLLGDTHQIANTLNNLALVAHLHGEVERALALWNECLDLLGESGDQRLAALVLNNLGLLHHRRGEYLVACQCYSASLAKKRALGDKQGIANVLGNLGLLARDQGEYRQAAELLDESLTQHRALGDKQPAAEACRELGDLARRRGDMTLAQQLIEESLAIARDVGDQQGTAWALVYRGRLACDLGDLARASAYFEEALRLYATLSDRRGAVLCLEGLASVAYCQKRPTGAVRLFASTAALRLAIGAPLSPSERTDYDRLLAQARAALGEAGFTVAWEAGKQLSFEQVLAGVLVEEPVLTAASIGALPAVTHRRRRSRHAELPVSSHHDESGQLRNDASAQSISHGLLRYDLDSDKRHV